MDSSDIARQVSPRRPHDRPRALRSDLHAFSLAIEQPLADWQAESPTLERGTTVLVAPRQLGIVFGPSDVASIIGFPFGQSGGGALGIWVQGTMASEPSLDFNELPAVPDRQPDAAGPVGLAGDPLPAERVRA